MLKKWELWIAIAGVIAAFWQGWEAHGARRDAQEIELKRRQVEATSDEKQQTIEELQKQLQEQRNELCQFRDLYQTKLLELHNAISRYQESPTRENQDGVIASAQAFVDFVEAWRRVQPLLADLLDGHVQALANALLTKDFDTIRLQQQTLERSADTELPLLEQALRQAVPTRTP